MRLGLFGAGRIGTFHAAVLSTLPQVEGLAIHDPVRERADELAAQVGAKVATSSADLAGTVDAAVIATPSSTHIDLVQLCLEHRLPTFCEKPVSQDLAALRAVCNLVHTAGSVLQVGFQRRFDAGYAEARRLRREGALGTVYGFRAYSHDAAPPALGYIASSGGVFRDMLIHDFDIVRFVLEREVEEVYATGSVLAVPEFGDLGDYDTCALVLRLSDGALGVLTGGRHHPAGYDVRMELFGSRDTVAVGLDEHAALRSVEPGMPAFAGPAHPDFQERFADAYRRELAAFVDVARGAAANPCGPQDAYEALRIATAADRSAHQGRPVRLDEVAP